MPVILHHGAHVLPRSIEERLKGPVFDDLVVIVPTRRRIRHLVREVMRLTGNPVTPAFPFYTLELFATQLYRRTASPRRIISGPLQTLVFEAAIRKRQESLEYFGMRGSQTRLPAGTFERIMETIIHLKESGVWPARLKEEALNAPLDEQRKLQDIAAIAEEYDAELERNGAIDVPGLIAYFGRSCSLEEFVPLFRRLFPGVDLLSLAGFDEFTAPELDVLQLLTSVPGLGVTLLFDYESGNPALFGHLEANYRRFREMGFVPVRDTAPRQRLFPVNTISRSPSSRQAADHFARYLFLANRPPTKVDVRDSVTLIGAASRRKEVQTIFRLIKHCVRTQPGLDLGTVCVAMLRPQLYTDLFREECSRYGIPANITDRYQLSRAPLVVHLLNLLKIPLGRYRREDVLEVAASPYFSFGESRHALNVPVLADVSGSLRITGGTGQWRRKIDQALEVLGKEGPAEAARIGRTADRLREARSEFDLLCTALSGIEAPMPPGVFAARLARLLEELHLPENLLKSVTGDPRDLTERVVRSYAKFLEALDEMVELLAHEDGRDTSHSLRTYVEQLTTSVLRERYNVREQFGAGVLITSIDETRGLSMGTMIVAGLVDGEFPFPYQPEVFLSAERRKERERRSQWQNRYLFYQAITNWADHLYLTYPRREGECELVRSSFVDSLLQIADVERWEREEDLPFRNDLLSEEEVLIWAVGRKEDAPPEVPSGLLPVLGDVRHAVAVERQRMVRDALPGYAGILSGGLSGHAQGVLEKMADRPVSVTQLETYGKCPYRYFAERLLELHPPQDLEEELTALEKGSILHEVLFEFYEGWCESKKPPLGGCSEETFAEASASLTRILEQKLRSLDIPDDFWQLETELLLGGSGRRQGFVREFLRAEQMRSAESIPSWFEVSFGGKTGKNADPHLSQDTPVEVGSLRLRGKVDRIEVGDDFFTIVDYKTGEVRARLEDIRRGMSLQLPLYMLAIQSILSMALKRDIRPAAGLYYQLKTPIRIVPGLAAARYKNRAFGSSTRSRQILRSVEEFDALIQESVGKAEEFVRGIRAGRFPLTSPDNIADVCSLCDFKVACRIQAARHVASVLPEDT
jgi:ATP-dependent helicase/nuclease subunit B